MPRESDTYPIRVGTHFNPAFALALTHEYAVAARDDALDALLRDRASAWYGRDADCQAWEPGGDDFLSSALIEAECMGRLLPPENWKQWMDAFLPRVAAREPRTLFEPATVTDRSDGKIAHLDGDYAGEHWLATYALLALLA